MHLNKQEKPLSTPPPTWNQPPADKVRSNILFAFGLVLALALAWHLREILVLIYVSALFAVVLLPVVDSLVLFEIRSGRHLSRAAAIALILTSVVIILVIFFVVALPPVIRDLHGFAADLPARIPGIVARIKRMPLAGQLGVDTVAEKLEGALSATAEYLIASFPAWMGRIFGLLTGFVLCVYFMLEGQTAYQWFMSLLPVEKRLRLAVTLEKAETRMSRWLFGQVLLMLIMGVCSTIAFGLLHVRYFFLLGVLMGLFNIIPVAGAIVTVTLVALIAALDSWTKMAGVLIFYLIYVNIENAYLTPRIMRSSVNLMGLTVIIALLIGTALAGVVGALVAVPTAALIAVLMEEYMVKKDAVYLPEVPAEDPPGAEIAAAKHR
jgi:predicted PurR-regulated permease PerM